MKIKDRVFLGMVAGFSGNIVKTIIDEMSLRKKISQRSYRATAAGVWVSKKTEATNIKGQLLGAVFDFGMAGLGGIGIVNWLSRTGKDYILPKGIISGITIGATITALLSVSPQNKVRPKDAVNNLSYLLANCIYGIVTSVVAIKLGHDSVFDAAPMNDYLEPTEQTTEEQQSNL
ncbi:MAG: hypothetical protein RBT41_03235 [Clostridia bacterium]|jgi:hypothetical protein|nr:hypothetical protein [Clostridia bacterium]